MMGCKLCINVFCRHHPRKRVIQYSATPAIYLNRRGVLDARLRGHDSWWTS
jgi:hypothetical protein